MKLRVHFSVFTTLLPIRMTWGIPTELWIQKRDTKIALQYSTYSLLFFMTETHRDQSRELSKNCSSNLNGLGVIWGLDWLRHICSQCSCFQHALLYSLFHLFVSGSECACARARVRLRWSSGSVRVSTCECGAAEINLQESPYPPVPPLYLLLPQLMLMPQWPAGSLASPTLHASIKCAPNAHHIVRLICASPTAIKCVIPH